MFGDTDIHVHMYIRYSIAAYEEEEDNDSERHVIEGREGFHTRSLPIL